MAVLAKKVVPLDDVFEGSVFKFENFKDMMRFERALYYQARYNGKMRPVFSSSQENIGKRIEYRLVCVGFAEINRRQKSN